jgi:excinuclease UvrABC nuclease subunit
LVDENLIYAFDHTKLPVAAGVYVFCRRYGKHFEALCVGKANAIRWRVRDQFKNLPLMMHLKKAKNGKRVIRSPDEIYMSEYVRSGRRALQFRMRRT